MPNIDSNATWSYWGHVLPRNQGSKECSRKSSVQEEEKDAKIRYDTESGVESSARSCILAYNRGLEYDTSWMTMSVKISLHWF